MIDFDIIYEDEDLRKDADEDLVRKAASWAGEKILAEGCFSLSFVTEETMRSENAAYRGIDSVTDILTFALSDGEDFPPVSMEGEEKEWGDILICTVRMKENAAEFASSDREELLRLIIHGILHLSGADHETNDFQKEPMLIRQEALLKELESVL